MRGDEHQPPFSFSRACAITLATTASTWSATVTPVSARNVRADYKSAGVFFGYDAATAPKWFVQYWIKLAPNWHWGASTPSTAASAGRHSNGGSRLVEWLPITSNCMSSSSPPDRDCLPSQAHHGRSRQP